MKLQATTRTTTERVITGEIAAEELLTMLTRSIQLPSGSTVTFYVENPAGGTCELTQDVPLRFTATVVEQKHTPEDPTALVPPAPPPPQMPRPPRLTAAPGAELD